MASDLAGTLGRSESDTADGLFTTVEASQLFDESPGNQLGLHRGGQLEKPQRANSLITETEMYVCCGRGLIQSALME